MTSKYGPLTVAPDQVPLPEATLPAADGPQTLVLGGGCFWCTEAVYNNVRGVTAVRSGYAGDSEATADYKTVCSGTTNHAEVIEITYDPAVVSHGTLMQLFMSIAHDPTQKDRQGVDVGRQYRSVVFYQSEEEKAAIEAYFKQLSDAGIFVTPIQTTLEPLEAFYEAELYHQDYATKNPTQAFIVQAALPKVEKLKKTRGDVAKD